MLDASLLCYALYVINLNLSNGTAAPPPFLVVGIIINMTVFAAEDVFCYKRFYKFEVKIHKCASIKVNLLYFMFVNNRKIRVHLLALKIFAKFLITVILEGHVFIFIFILLTNKI